MTKTGRQLPYHFVKKPTDAELYRPDLNVALQTKWVTSAKENSDISHSNAELIVDRDTYVNALDLFFCTLNTESTVMCVV